MKTYENINVLVKNTIFNLTTFSVVIVLGIIGVVQRNFKINVYSILTGIYVILVTVSCFMSEFGLKNNMWGNCGRGEGLVTIFSYIITFLIFTHNYKCLKKSIKIAIIGSIGVAVYATLQANFNISYSLLNDTAAKGVAKGTMMNQNFLSSYICIFLPMMCYYYINTKGEKMLIVIALLFSTLMYSKTLGGYITFVFMALCICAISVIYSNKLKDAFSRILKLLLTIVITFVIITKEQMNIN